MRRYVCSLAVGMLLVSNGAASDELQNTALRPCATGTAASGKVEERRDAASLVLVANELESQGEAKFHLEYSAPSTECVLESFDVKDVKVTATYNAPEKGLSTLSYRFKIQRPGVTTEVLVLSSGMAAIFAGAGPVFHLSEERGGAISWYAMYKREPPYQAVRALVEQIITGEAKPLMAVRWPPGAKEAELLAYDTKRLK